MPTFGILRLGSSDAAGGLDAWAMRLAQHQGLYASSSAEPGIQEIKGRILADRQVIRLYVEDVALAPPPGYQEWIEWIWSGIKTALVAIQTFFFCPPAPEPPVVDETAQRKQAAQEIVVRKLTAVMAVRQEQWPDHENLIPELATAILDGLVASYNANGPYHQEAVQQGVQATLQAHQIQEDTQVYKAMNRLFARISGA